MTTAVELGQINAQVEDYATRSIKERTFERQRDAETALKKLPTKLYDRSFGMGRLALSCALFGFGRGARQRFDAKVLETYRGGNITYSGPELRQDDQSVLLGLVYYIKDTLIADEIKFSPREFCRFIGWSGCSTDVTKLRDCLERMTEAHLRITFGGNKGGMFSLVSQFTWDGDKWSVWLAPTLRRLFEDGTTFLPIEERAALTDGLQTWLAGFLRAQSDVSTFGTDDLHKFSGTGASIKEFGRQLRDTMDRLQEVGVVKGFDFGRGRLTVQR
jgi:hypothetical protein